MRKGLDSNYIRGYNCTRDTTYRSPRPSRLSPTAQRQAGGTLPKSHPTTQNQLPQPPACFKRKLNSSPPCGEVAAKPPEGLLSSTIGIVVCFHRHLDLQIYESQGQEASQRQVPPADAPGRPPHEHGRPRHRRPDRDGIAQ